jgi:hypothetical protein
MSDLLSRLINLVRANLRDLYTPSSSFDPFRDFPFDLDDDPDPASATDFTAAGGATGRASGLPYSDEVARCYQALDLPFGTPMDDVTKRWKTYLKQCHPDRFATDPTKLADATELTQALTAAHATIRTAWNRYQA